jgi:hypothetical protein
VLGAVTILAKDGSGKILLATGTTVPSAGTGIYAKGAIFIDTNVADGSSALYENTGTVLSYAFTALPAANAAASVALSSALIADSAALSTAKLSLAAVESLALSTALVSIAAQNSVALSTAKASLAPQISVAISTHAAG